MVYILSFDDVAKCLGVSLDTATRIIERDLPIVPLKGRGNGERQQRGVDLEALEIYVQKVSLYSSPLAAEIHLEVVRRRAERQAAYERRLAERGVEQSTAEQVPAIVRAKRTRGAKRTRRGPGSDDTGGSGSATST